MRRIIGSILGVLLALALLGLAVWIYASWQEIVSALAAMAEILVKVIIAAAVCGIVLYLALSFIRSLINRYPGFFLLVFLLIVVVVGYYILAAP
jgi:hypothetical protein